MIVEANLTNITKDQILNLLREQEIFVSFENKSGDQRRMLCTLKPSYISDYKSKGTAKKDNDDVVYVWDIEVSGFRAFNISKIDKLFVI